MRLLETKTLSIKQFPSGDTPDYAILSHVWGQEEVTLRDIEESQPKDKNGYAKVQDCCKRALQDGFEYIWIDTCCIDKTSSAELSEAINSMYTWYQEAGICYAYLADISSQEEIAESKWFTRGWTLQELIAPSIVIFLDRNWEELGTKVTLSDILSSQTGIPEELLYDTSARDILLEYSVAQKMSWAAGRTTTRVEDRAYSLLGIFGIHMPLIYGEGENAFIRLQEEIIKISDDHTLFAWSHVDNRGGLLATSPDAFRDSGKIIQYQPDDDPHTAPYISSRGVHLELPFIATLKGLGVGGAVLNCRYEDKEDEPITIFVQDTNLLMQDFKRTQTSTLERLKRNRPQAEGSVRKICIRRPHTLRSSVAIPDEIGPKDKWKDHTSLSPQRVCIPALRDAALRGRGDLVWYLLTYPNIASWSQKGNLAGTILDAVRGGDPAVVKMLLVGSGIREFHIPASYEEPRLMSEAVALQHYHIIKLLLERGFTPNTTIVHAGIRMSILSYAAICGLESIARLLLKHDANINSRDDNGQTPLHHAIDGGHENVVLILINKGADVDQGDAKGRTPLLLAVEKGYRDIVEILVLKGVDVNRPNGKGRTPISHAVEKGDQGIVEILAPMSAEGELSKNRKVITNLLSRVSRRRF